MVRPMSRSASVVVADRGARIGPEEDRRGAREADHGEGGGGEEDEAADDVHRWTSGLTCNPCYGVYRLLVKITHLRVTCQAL